MRTRAVLGDQAVFTSEGDLWLASAASMNRDGQRLAYVPVSAEWVQGGQWVIEGTGVTPDMVVPDDPAAVLAGRDPQLDRAIEYLKQKLHDEPVAHPAPPPFPVKTTH